MACGMVMELGVFGLFRQMPATTLGRSEPAIMPNTLAKVRRTAPDKRIIRPENKDGEPHRQSTENCRQRPLIGGTFQ